MAKGKHSILRTSTVILISALCTVSVSFAEPPPVQSKPAAPTKMVLPVQPKPAPTMKKVLQGPLLISEGPTLALSFQTQLFATIDRVHHAYSPINFTDCPSGWFGLAEVYYGGYKTYAHKCMEKSYSIQEQQSAGCQGNDTVDQCNGKLFKYCLSRYEQEKNTYPNQNDGDLKTKIRKGIEKSDRVSNEARELSSALRSLQSLMP